MGGAFDFTAQQWATLRNLLDEALDLEPAQRAVWLDALPARGHAALAPRLRSLLGAADEGGTLQRLLHTLPRVEGDPFVPPPASASGAPVDAATIGPYRLLRELGSGGMASVWLAERTDMLQRRQVALKLPHGAWKRAGLAERLTREREILATLEHPNIARLYDAGVASDGQPYLALEYVEGESIDAFAKRQALDVPARLRLFLQVIRAVAYAHAQLVVHRDLKPSNILVSGAGEVKLLDFGIAKLLDGDAAAETALTQMAGRALTPDYAAPEQIVGQPIGTAADVYALGVVLFELLAGRRPYTLSRESRGALEEAIVSAEVPRPSTLAPPERRAPLRGDLDTIVLMALKKQPRERYATVDAFGEDIRRHLEGLPVSARPDGVRYRAAKFVGRHLAALSAVGAVVLALALGTAVSVWQAREALAAKERADNEARIARSAARTAQGSQRLSEYLLADSSAVRSPEELTRQLDRASAAMRVQYARDAETLAILLATIAGRHRQLGENARFRALAAEALVAARQAQDVALGAHVECWLGIDAAESGAVEQAIESMSAAVRMLQRPDVRVRDPTGVVQTLRSCRLDRAAVLRMTGRLQEAIAEIEAVRAFERAEGLEDLEMLADTAFRLGITLSVAGRFREALDQVNSALELHRRAGREHSLSGDNALLAAASIQGRGGRPDHGIKQLGPLLARTRGSIAVSNTRAELLLGLGQAEEAHRAFSAGYADAERKANVGWMRSQALLAAEAAYRAGDVVRTGEWLDRAEPHFRGLEQVPYSRQGWLIASSARALLQGDLDRAGLLADEAETSLTRHALIRDPAWRRLHRVRAQIWLAARDARAALVHADAALSLSRAQALDPEQSVHVGEDLLLRARALAAAGDGDASRRAAGQALEHFQGTASPVHPDWTAAQRLHAAR